MRQEFDFAASLGAVLEGRRDAWAFVEGFAAEWSDAALRPGEDGWSGDELDAVEARLGLRLPVALREAYGLIGRRRDLTCNHDELLDPAELYVDAAGEALVFRHENQGAASWGVCLDRLGEDDPAVVVRADLADKSAERWEAWLGRFSLAVVELVLWESVMADDARSDFLDQDEDTAAAVLAADFVRLPFPTTVAGEEARWFLGGDVLVRDADGPYLARGRTAEALDRFRERIPGAWLNGY